MLNIHRILFPTDFSEGAKQAFPQAASLADWHDAELHLLNVTGRHRHDYETTRENFPVPTAQLDDWLGRQASGGGGWPDLEGLSITQRQIESAVPAETILDYATEEDVDLVVMGTHGRRGADRMLFGSVTEEVVRNAPCPALTVRQGADVAPQKAVRRVLVPVDFSDVTETAVRHAKEIAQTYGAEIDLLHVVEEPIYPNAYGVEPVEFPTQEVVERVEGQLADLARDEIGFEHVMVEATVGPPAIGILDYIEKNEVDLVVLATHGRTGFERVLLGSVTERVLRRSPKPVFVVKPDQKSLLSEKRSETTASVE